MLKSYILIALRRLAREKIYVFINILGLSLGIACCFILGLYLHSELTYDQHNSKHERIFRIVDEITTAGKVDAAAVTSRALGPLLTREYPELGEYVRFQRAGRTMLRRDDTEFFWEGIFLADDNVFDVFDHDIIYSDPNGALTDPSSIALSESVAKTYFGDTNPIGETIRTDSYQYKVTAVFADLPENSHLKYDALISYNRLGLTDDNNNLRQMLWNISDYTYLLLPEDTNPDLFNNLVSTFYDKYMAEVGRSFNSQFRFWIQPLKDIHFGEHLQYDQPTGNIFNLYGFAAVAIFILLVACINYTNLSTARAIKRSKEVGMRKVIGAEKAQLVMQFLGESLVFSTIALVFGFIFVEAALRLTPLGELLGKTQLFNLRSDPTLLLWLAGFSVLVGLLAGLYPAFYLSSISPLAALTATKKPVHSGLSLRKVLVFLQFAISIGVVACTLLMALQMHYVASKPLGFDKENKIIVRLVGVDAIEKVPLIRNELSSNPHILGMAETAFVPGQPISINLITIENNEGIMEPQTINRMQVGDDFFKVMNVEIAEGRDFSKRLLTDVGNSILVNEALVKSMGWDSAIGKRLQAGGGGYSAKVIGVVKDFNFYSLHEQVEPLVIQSLPKDLSNVAAAQRNRANRSIVISVAGEDIFHTINFIESVVTQFDPTHPFEFKFIDDALDEMYVSESNLMKLTGTFAGICIFISCLGLFGLATFTTEQRTKEIGIRKVLGASTWQVILLLSTHFFVSLAVAAVIASVISYFVIDDWLASFAYHTAINPLVFIVSTILVAIIAFITVSLQSAKTAQANPVLALRYE